MPLTSVYITISFTELANIFLDLAPGQYIDGASHLIQYKQVEHYGNVEK